MSNATIIDHMDGLRECLERMGEDDMASMQIALAHCVQALRYAKDADGLTPTRRQQARSAYAMACAALSIGEAYDAKVRA